MGARDEGGWAFPRLEWAEPVENKNAHVRLRRGWKKCWWTRALRTWEGLGQFDTKSAPRSVSPRDDEECSDMPMKIAGPAIFTRSYQILEIVKQGRNAYGLQRHGDIAMQTAPWRGSGSCKMLQEVEDRHKLPTRDRPRLRGQSWLLVDVVFLADFRNDCETDPEFIGTCHHSSKSLPSSSITFILRLAAN